MLSSPTSAVTVSAESISTVSPTSTSVTMITEWAGHAATIRPVTTDGRVPSLDRDPEIARRLTGL